MEKIIKINFFLNLFLVRVKLHLEDNKKGFHFSVKGKNLKVILEKNNYLLILGKKNHEWKKRYFSVT